VSHNPRIAVETVPATSKLMPAAGSEINAEDIYAESPPVRYGVVPENTSLGEERRSSVSLQAPTAQVFEVDPLKDPRWTPLVQRHPHASVFHSVEWLNALKISYGYTPVALTFSPPGSLLENAILFCQVRSALTGNRLVSLPFSDHCEPLVNHPREVDLFVRTLVKKVDEKNWKYFEIRPIVHAPNDADLTVCHSYYFHVVDLRENEQVLFKTLHKDSIQRKIRRAEREGLRYEEGTSETLLDHFYKLMIGTRREHGLPPQSLKWFRAVITCMAGNAKIRVAYKGDTPVASILTLSSRNRVVYKYGCSDSRFTNLGGTAMLFWRTIQEAKAAGREEFDLGRSDLDNPGLITFKERWGAQRKTIEYWHYPASSASSSPESLIKYAKRLISIMPDKPLTIIGNLLYRHIA